MARNKVFTPGREPFSQSDLDLKPSHIHGPFSFLNPTKAHFQAQSGDLQHAATSSGSSDEHPKDDAAASNVKFLWRSRDNRKGRHALIVQQLSPGKDQGVPITTPQKTAHPRAVLRTVGKMLTNYPVWDISWLVAYIFTWGSIVWCINGFFSFLPFIRPKSEFPGEVLYGGGITAFIGAVLFFEIGSILLMFEAVNENRAGCFGWAVERLLEDEPGRGSRMKISASKENCTHHHRNKKNLVGKGLATDITNEKSGGQSPGQSWRWFPTYHDLRTHYIHELGFLASFSQFCGATIFGIAGITALPGIIKHMPQRVENGIYWVPQIVGGCGFIISGTLYLLETQKKWYTPAFSVLGWHIAFWNLIGGIGFTLCGALGPAAHSHGSQYQAACATFWGSFAFLIGSLLQLYESLQKNPVEEVKIS